MGNSGQLDLIDFNVPWGLEITIFYFWHNQLVSTIKERF